jgi:ATP-dependent Lon protease
LNIVKELGEDALPEEKALPNQKGEAMGKESAATNSEPEATKTATADDSIPRTDEAEDKTVTTETRQPLKVPDSISIKVTPENLKDYVGPPVYHKDRMYARAPPPGVSTGLGYLGNGSGAVMPIEATVRPRITTDD